MRYHCIVISAALLLACVSPAAAEDEPQDQPLWSLSSSVNYSVGDYGTGKDTTFIYVPFTLGVKPIDGFTLSLTIPYVYQTGETVVITGGGVAVRKDKQRQLGSATQNQVTSTEHGLGDLLLKGQYVLIEEKSGLPEIAPYLKIKFPTADSDRGLGTGKFDETIGVDLSKTLFPRFVSYLTLAYTFVGSPAGTSFDNSFGWSVGAAYLVAQPFSVFAFLDGSTAISPGQANPLEVRVGADFRVTQALKIFGSVSHGLSDGSADWGASAGLALRF